MARIILILLLLAPLSAWGQAWDFSVGGSTTECDDSYIRQDASTSNYGASTPLTFGYNGTGKQYTMIFRFQNFGDSLAAYGTADEIDSILLKLTSEGGLASSESLLVATYTCRRWTTFLEGNGEAGVTWASYNGISAWGTAGAKNTTSDRYDDATTTTKLTSSNAGATAVNTFYINPTNFATQDSATVILEYVTAWGTSPLMSYSASEIYGTYAPYAPTLYVYGTTAAAATGCPKGRHGPDGNWTSSGICGNGEAHK